MFGTKQEKTLATFAERFLDPQPNKLMRQYLSEVYIVDIFYRNI
jgi:hypothetical protein